MLPKQKECFHVFSPNLGILRLQLNILQICQLCSLLIQPKLPFKILLIQNELWTKLFSLHLRLVWTAFTLSMTFLPAVGFTFFHIPPIIASVCSIKRVCVAICDCSRLSRATLESKTMYLCLPYVFVPNGRRRTLRAHKLCPIFFLLVLRMHIDKIKYKNDRAQ